MKVILHPERMEWLIRWGYWSALAGVVLIALAIGPLHDIGFVSGLMLLLCGGCSGGFRRWRQERGLWMLAVVALCAFLSLYVMMEWDMIRRELNGANPRPLLLGLDTALATSVVWLQVRFLVTVARVNRALFAPPRDWQPFQVNTAWRPNRGNPGLIPRCFVLHRISASAPTSRSTSSSVL